MKRLLFIIVIIICFCYGCSASEDPQQQPELTLPDSLKNVTFEKNIKLSIGFWDIQDMVNNKNSDSILSYIEDIFHITIEPISVNWSDYKERYQILSATGSLPDVFANVATSSSDNNDFTSLDNLILSHSIRSLPADLSAYPNIQKLLDLCGNIRSSDGNYYVLPRTSFQDPVLSSSDAAMLVRKDWMQSLGLSQPNSLDEFIRMVNAFANDDPDGNGLDDTIGYNVNNRIALGKWLMLGIAPECNVYSWIQSVDGYIPSYTTEDFKKVVRAYRTLYEQGGLDPNFYIKKSADSVNDFVSGKLGALEYKSSPSSVMKLKAQWDLYQDVPFEDCVDVIHIFPAKDGNCYRNTSSVYWSESLFSSQVNDEKMERILYLFNYLLSDEGLDLIKYGIKGTDYVKKEGEYKCLIDTKKTSLMKTLQKKYPSLYLFSSLATWGGTWDDFENNEINCFRYGDYSMELANKELQWNVENTLPVERPFDFILMPKQSTKYFNTEAVIDDFTKVIIGSQDPIMMWDSILDGYYENGLEDYIQRQNRMYADYIGLE